MLYYLFNCTIFYTFPLLTDDQFLYTQNIFFLKMPLLLTNYLFYGKL